MDEDTITIPRKKYLDLKDSEKLLLCLQNAGVDNWDGYDFALEEYHDSE